MLQSFYEGVLPPSGRYALFLGEPKRHIFCASIDELARKTEEFAGRRDVYFATCSLGPDNSRSGENAVARNTICFDIDAGEAKAAKHGDAVYPSQAEALEALVAWCRSNKFLPQYIVSSGHGLHVYFKLDRDMPAEVWRPLASAIKAKALADGLRIDGMVTGDMVRVLRPPGTLHKSGEAVEVLQHLPKAYTPEEIAAKFPVAHRERPRRSLNAEALAPVVVVPRSIHKIVAACAAMGHVAETGGNVAEPYWRAALGVAKHTFEGMAAAHMLSEGHPDYDPDQTEAKFDRWNAGPSACETFATENPGACASCPHRGKIKSPIVLGTMEAKDMPSLDPLPVKSETSAEDTPFASDDDDDDTGMANGPKVPWDGYLPDGVAVRPIPGGFGMFRIETMPVLDENGKPTKETREVELRFAGVPFWFESWTPSTSSDDSSTYDYAVYNAQLKTVTRYSMVSQTASKRDTLLVEFGKRNIQVPSEGAKKSMEGFVRDSIERIRAFGMRQKIPYRLGMYADHNGNLFVAHGKHVIYSDGTIAEAGLGKGLSSTAAQYAISLPYSPTAKWGPEVWDAHILPRARAYVDHLRATVREDQPQYKLAIMLSLASPLIAFANGDYRAGGDLPEIGFTVSLFSEKTGLGKSLAMKLAAMAYGTTGLSKVRNGESATQNAREKQIARCGTLPFFMDEAGDRTTPAQLSSLVKGIGNGRAGKDRMNSDQDIVETPGTALINLMATNVSVRELVAAANENTNAAIMRMLEIDCSDMPQLDKSLGLEEKTRRAAMGEVNGCFGAVVHRAIVRLGPARCNQLLLACTESACAALGEVTQGRIMADALGAVLALQRIMKTEGMELWSNAELKAEFKKWYDNSMRFGQAATVAATSKDQIARMLSDIQNEVLTTDILGSRTPGAAKPVVRGQVPQVVNARIVEESGEAFVRLDRVRRWCHDNQIGMQGLINRAVVDGLLLTAPGEPDGWRRRVTLTRGVVAGAKIATVVMAINLKRMNAGADDDVAAPAATVTALPKTAT